MDSSKASSPDAEPDAVVEADRAAGTRRRRPALIWTLIVVASLIGLASILTTWVHRQMLDNQSWEDASAELIQDQQVRDAVSVFLVASLYDNVDVAAGLEERLPENLKPLAAPVAGALREPATDAVERLLDAPRVQQLWINANAVAHEKLVNVLENKTGHGISTGRRRRHAGLERARDRARHRARAAGRGAGEDPARGGRDHRLALGSAVRRPGRRAGGTGAEHGAAGAGARPLRARDLPRAR